MIATTTAIDPNKNWVFHFGSLVPNEVPLKMEDRNGTVCFSVPFEPQRKIYIELFSYNEEKKVIEGRYSLGDSRFKYPVNFEVLKGGRLLRGNPSGALSRHFWTISLKE